MKKKLTISLIQTEIFWQNKQKNFDYLSSKIAQTNADLVLLPEMFNTGFNIKPFDLAEDFNGPTLKWLIEQAKNYNTAIIGSFIFKDNDNYYNRLFFVRPDGQYAFYDKRHTFTMADEHKFFTKGNRNIIINYLGWKIKPLICYDLRFPVWARNKEFYDLLIYVANWPDSRIDQWENLLIARAIENQAYVAAVNRIGTDGNGFYYSGNSLIISPKGQILQKAAKHLEQTITETLDMEQLHQMRQKFPVLLDKDSFTIDDEQIISYWHDP